MFRKRSRNVKEERRTLLRSNCNRSDDTDQLARGGPECTRVRNIIPQLFMHGTSREMMKPSLSRCTTLPDDDSYLSDCSVSTLDGSEVHVTQEKDDTLHWGKITSMRFVVQSLRNGGMYEEDQKIGDPVAKASCIMKRSRLSVEIVGDGDIWYETLCRNVKNDTIVSVFVSIMTGGKSRGEPPTGSSKVVYLKTSIRELYLKK